MNDELFNAILSMDAYNRGYNPEIRFGNLPNGESATLLESLGNATIIADTRGLVDEDDKRLDIASNFYAVAYERNGETIISYRGTDDSGSWTSLWTDGDVWNGWTVGTGSTQSRQAEMAFQFYHSIISGQQNSYTADVSFTGHSLGGGLGGLVGANDNNEQTRKIAA